MPSIQLNNTIEKKPKVYASDLECYGDEWNSIWVLQRQGVMECIILDHPGHCKGYLKCLIKEHLNVDVEYEDLVFIDFVKNPNDPEVIEYLYKKYMGLIENENEINLFKFQEEMKIKRFFRNVI